MFLYQKVINSKSINPNVNIDWKKKIYFWQAIIILIFIVLLNFFSLYYYNKSNMIKIGTDVLEL